MRFLIIILLFLWAATLSGAEGYMAASSLSRNSLPLSNYTIKNLGKYALLLAHQMSLLFQILHIYYI
ncbi:hypothetical protein JYG24_10440 [Lentisphaerota bacterium]|nr:hypothetical protein JYG24_10440 [Lentisphaerota bacterium]